MIRRWVAWIVLGLCAASLILYLPLRFVSPPFVFTDVTGTLQILGLVGVGVLVLVHRPENRLGWVYTMGGTLYAASSLAFAYADYALRVRPGALPGGAWAALLGEWTSTIGWAMLVTFGFLLFPNGRLPSRRWRVVAWVAAACIAILASTIPVRPGRLYQLQSVNVNNPLGIAALSPFMAWVDYIGIVFLVCAVASIVSVFVHYRGAAPIERQQIKWAAYIAVLLSISAVSGQVVESIWDSPVAATLASVLRNDIGGLLFTAFPLAIGVAILRYGLWDIDVIINRTLVYGALTAAVALIYVGSVVVLRELLAPLLGGNNEIAVVASTLAIAALFHPLRRRIQTFIDRRFYRRKYDAAKTLDAFSVKLREETDLDALRNDLLAVVQETVQPAHVSVWLRDGGLRSAEQSSEPR